MLKLPLYKKIEAEIFQRISSGVYPLGELLPTEAQLVEEFGASHHTVRHALSLLSERGLIVRRAGSGSRVIAVQENTVFSHSVGNLKQLLRYPSSTYRQIIEFAHVQVDDAEASMLDCAVGTPWFRVKTVRRTVASEEPICCTDIYLLPRHADIINQPDHSTTPVYEQIERVYGDRVESAKVDITASILSEEQAKLLQCEPGTAAIVVLRAYADQRGDVFEVTKSVHPESRFSYSLSFKREKKFR